MNLSYYFFKMKYPIFQVYKQAVEKVIENMKKAYKGTPTFYICTPYDGARIVQDF